MSSNGVILNTVSISFAFNLLKWHPPVHLNRLSSGAPHMSSLARSSSGKEGALVVSLHALGSLDEK